MKYFLVAFSLEIRNSAEIISAGCLQCHSGARGSGTTVYTFDEIGTDPALADWGDPDGDGEMCCGVEGSLTGGIKAPRLTGLYALTRFLHNGSLTSLEQLFCLEVRPPAQSPPYAITGHEFGCDLTDSEKFQLLDFLKAL